MVLSQFLLLIERFPGSLDAICGAWSDTTVVRLGLEQAGMAPDLISRENVGLVVCELDADAVDAFAVLQQIRRVHSHLPMLMISPVRDLDLVLGAFRNGADDVLVQPFADIDFSRAVQHALDKGRTQAALAALQQTAERSLDELVLLKMVSETASSEENLQKLLDRIVVSIQAALGVEIVSLMLADADNLLKISAARGLPEEVLQSVRIPAGDGIAGHVLQYAEAVLINDLATDGRFPPRDGVDRYRTGSLLSVPICYQDRILGVLNVNNKQSGEGFSADDQELLTAIAHQAALAIENFKLVSNLRQKTQELEQTHANLVKLHEGRTRFVCNLSHELKTPLTSVLGFADLLMNFYDQVETDQVRDYLERIHAEALSLEKLLNGMLRLFSLDSGSENWCWQNLDLNDAIDLALRQFQPGIVAKDLDLEFCLAEDLLPVWGDQDKLLLLLDCLVDNAVKFNRRGGILAIRTENRQENGRFMVYLSIANDGVSVPLEHAEEIFLDYAQLGDMNTEKPAGVGIGLATCRAILRNMHGRIFLEQHERAGTRFGLLLPTQAAFEEFDDGTTTD